MPKCILHIGMHKTGTTSIQNSLRNLDDSSFYYARLLDRPNHSVTVSAMFARANDPKLRSKRFNKGQRNIQDDIAQGRRDLARSIAAAEGRTLIISGEGMLRMSADDIVRLKDFLQRHGYDDIEVVAYIRSPAAYISSAVQQKLKAGNTGVFNLENSLPDYQEKFEKYDKAFGRDKVRLFKFEPARFPEGDVVADFCQKTGIPLTSIKRVRKNESISRLAAQLRFQHATIAEAEGLKPIRASAGAALCESLRILDKTRFRLAPSLTGPVVDSIAADVQWMEQRLGESLSETLEDHPDDVHGADDLLRPIPGINEKLRELLEQEGLSVPPAAADSTVRLVHLVAQSARQRLDVAAGQSTDDGGLPHNRRALRQEQRKTQRAQKAGKGRRAERAGQRAVKADRADREGRRRRGRATSSLSWEAEVATAPVAAPLLVETVAAQFAAPEPVPVTVAKSGSPVTLEMSAPAKAPSTPSRTIAPLKAKEPVAQSEAKLIRSARQMMRAAGQGRTMAQTPLTMGPVPLLSKEKGLIVLWSPKSACTTTYVWFSNLCGFVDEVRSYASWPHRHRQEMYMKSDMYLDSANSGMKDAKILRIIRDPYARAVSIYRHALQTHFADADMAAFSGGRISAEKGYSFQTFLDLLEQLDMRRVDMHFRPQFHPLERERKPDVVINITKSDLFAGLNAFEAASGYATTNFEDLNWLHSLESKRKAKQEPMEGDALDHVPFTRQQVARLGLFPSYAQLLTPQAKQRIEAIYKADFDAYRDLL